MIDIRKALKEDTDSLHAFLVSVFGDKVAKLAEGYLNCMFSNDYRRPTFIIATTDNGKIIGAAAYSEEFFTVNLWGISWVSVDEDHRRKKIGTKLVEHCLKEITEVTDKSVTVILDSYPEKADVYKNLGFKGIGQSHSGSNLMIKYLEQA